MVKALSWLSLLVLVGAGVVLPEYIGAIQKGYSSAINYLSELGAFGAPYATVINYGSFLPIAFAVVILVFAFFQKIPPVTRARIGTLCLLGITVGYLGTFLFRCDAGCPTDGSERQILHNLSGLIEYTGAVAGLVLIYSGLRKTAPLPFTLTTLITVLLIVLGLVMMAIPQMQEWKGAWQRLAEYSLVVWFIVATLWQPKPGISKKQ